MKIQNLIGKKIVHIQEESVYSGSLTIIFDDETCLQVFPGQDHCHNETWGTVEHKITVKQH